LSHVPRRSHCQRHGFFQPRGISMAGYFQDIFNQSGAPGPLPGSPPTDPPGGTPLTPSDVALVQLVAALARQRSRPTPPPQAQPRGPTPPFGNVPDVERTDGVTNALDPPESGTPASGQVTPEQMATLETHLKHPNVQGFLSLVANTEGATYNSRFGDRLGGRRKTFDDYSQYPDGGPANDPSGRYQFNPNTYDDLSRKLGLTDYSPHTQDLMAVQRIIDRGAMPSLLAGDLDAVLPDVAPEWASLPQGSGALDMSFYKKQHTTPYAEVRRLFDLYRAP